MTSRDLAFVFAGLVIAVVGAAIAGSAGWISINPGFRFAGRWPYVGGAAGAAS